MKRLAVLNQFTHYTLIVFFFVLMDAICNPGIKRDYRECCVVRTLYSVTFHDLWNALFSWPYCLFDSRCILCKMFRYATWYITLLNFYVSPCTRIFGHYSFTLQAMGTPNGDLDFMVEIAHNFKSVWVSQTHTQNLDNLVNVLGDQGLPSITFTQSIPVLDTYIPVNEVLLRLFMNFTYLAGVFTFTPSFPPSLFLPLFQSFCTYLSKVFDFLCLTSISSPQIQS